MINNPKDINEIIDAIDNLSFEQLDEAIRSANEMNEEEIINEIGFCLSGEWISLEHEQAIKGLLDLYNQEKKENRNKNIVIIEYQDLLEREQEKNKKLEEVIDMMATFIGYEDIEGTICKNANECYRDNEDGDYFPCKACVKEYFFKEARGEENE